MSTLQQWTRSLDSGSSVHSTLCLDWSKYNFQKNLPVLIQTKHLHWGEDREIFTFLVLMKEWRRNWVNPSETAQTIHSHFQHSAPPFDHLDFPSCTIHFYILILIVWYSPTPLTNGWFCLKSIVFAHFSHSPEVLKILIL